MSFQPPVGEAFILEALFIKKVGMQKLPSVRKREVMSRDENVSS